MVSRDEIKNGIKELIERYNKIANSEKIKSFNEQQTKTTFIEPFFELLNWKVREPDEVSLEEKVSKKRVDYAFKVNGVTKFFVEAKSLKEDLNNPEFAKQVIEYSYNKGITWAVLTNFKEIKVFNAEWVPKDNIFNNQFISLSIEQFLEQDSLELLWLLSKESIISGDLDKKAEKVSKKIKKQPIDKQLLNDFTIWRQILSKNILIYNKDKNFTEEELDEVVQRILDRLIFIRKCEDNGLEDNIMKTKLREWEETRSKGFYTYLQGIFRYFDENYDSELFRRHSCDDVIITNDVLREIVSGLYETKDKMISYDFSVIDADVLGSVYEQYLGHILKKSEKRAKVTENYVYKKKEGIYYTPIYVVDYIVRNTLGELLKDKKVNPEKIRILDPTCGSGSFLIKAFDVLNEHYSKSKIYDQTTLDTKTLTTFKTKERILINNIFGVDLDKKAVEIAQLNLLLKIAEKGHRLPLLKQNIKCGNSFIDDVTLVGDKAFSWETEFKFILDAGGFDITIGNPPYVHQKGEKDSPLINFKEREYYRKNYESILGKNGKTRGGVKINLFIPYVERCIKLLKEQGKIGFIVHKNILKVESYKFLRRFMLKNCAIETIVDLGGGVFKDVTGETIIMILRKESNPEKRKKNTISIIYGLSSESDLLKGDYSRNEIKQQFFETAPDNMFTIYMDKGINDIKTKMWKGSVKLEDLVSIVSFGLNTVDNKKYFVGQKLNDKYKKAVMGRDIGRWVIKNKNKFVCYDNKVLTRIGDEKSFLAKEKLIMQRIGAGLVCAYDDEQYYCYNSTNMILQKEQRFNLKYILALLNSKLLNTYYRILFATKADLTVNVTQGYLSQLPIRTISESQQQPLIKLVDKMLSLNKRLNKIGDKKTDERTKIEEEIKKTDAEIDEIVYKIYGMNEKEKKIIEGGLE